MITISRRLARQLRTVFRRALPKPPRGSDPAVLMMAHRNLLQIRSRVEGVAVTYELRGRFKPTQFALPQQFLRDCEAARNDLVELEVAGDQKVVARWPSADLMQVQTYDQPTLPEPVEWPTIPRELAENPAQLLTALRDASETTNPESSRFALGHIQLRGAHGEIAATDGRQLLLERGFVFPWQEDLLVARNRVFASKELKGEDTVFIGYAENWVTLRIGPWTLQFAANQTGRFPRVDDVVRRAETATSSCYLPPVDLLRLQRSLKLLPGDDVFNSPVTLDLNGHLRVRAKAEGVSEPTELELPASRPTGEPVRIVVNRCYLERVAKLGLGELHLFGPEAALLAQDDRRSYVWMPLSPTLAVLPSRKLIPTAAAA